MTEALVIGAGPAGLMAAEVMAEAGLRVTVAEAKPSVARKFLMAGKSGLNITKDEPPDHFHAAFAEAEAPLAACLKAFGPAEVQDWVRGLGQNLFTGSTGRVFPEVMKASPLLRAWMARLERLGVETQTRWAWQGWLGEDFVFDTPLGREHRAPRVAVLALGGASWARLGSTGAWAEDLEKQGVPLAPFAPANAGLQVAWSAHMARHFGAPIKSVAWSAGPFRDRGEAVLAEHGLEGGGIYSVSRGLREGHDLHVDLAPNLSVEEVTARIARPRKKASLSNHLRKVLKLSQVQIALLQELARPLPDEAEALARVIKDLPIRAAGLRPMDEAISTAGGVRFDGVDEGLMLRARPGVFVAGEMLDWEAPTGGYLITACLATGRWAGKSAANWANV